MVIFHLYEWTYLNSSNNLIYILYTWESQRGRKNGTMLWTQQLQCVGKGWQNACISSWCKLQVHGSSHTNHSEYEFFRHLSLIAEFRINTNAKRAVFVLSIITCVCRSCIEVWKLFPCRKTGTKYTWAIPNLAFCNYIFHKKLMLCTKSYYFTL